MSGQRFPDPRSGAVVRSQRFSVGTPVYWAHEGPYQTATVAHHGRDAAGVYTEIQLEDGSTLRVHRSQLKKARVTACARTAATHQPQGAPRTCRTLGRAGAARFDHAWSLPR